MDTKFSESIRQKTVYVSVHVISLFTQNPNQKCDLRWKLQTADFSCLPYTPIIQVDLCGYLQIKQNQEIGADEDMLNVRFQENLLVLLLYLTLYLRLCSI